MKSLKFDLKRIDFKEVLNLSFAQTIPFVPILICLTSEEKIFFALIPSIILFILYNSFCILDIEAGIDKLVIISGQSRMKFYNSRYSNLFILSILIAILSVILFLIISGNLLISLKLGILNLFIAFLGGSIMIGVLYAIGAKLVWVGEVIVIIFCLGISSVKEEKDIFLCIIAFLIIAIIAYGFGKYEYRRKDY